VKELGRFEEFPLYFHLGDGREFLERAGEGASDAVIEGKTVRYDIYLKA
jgi:hypothetical protein